MSFATTLPNHLRPRREKVFGDGRPRDRKRPAAAAALAALIFHEVLGPGTIAGGILVLAAVAITLGANARNVQLSR